LVLGRKKSSILQISFWEEGRDYFAGGVHNFALLMTERTRRKGFVFWIRSMLRPRQYDNKILIMKPTRRTYFSNLFLH